MGGKLTAFKNILADMPFTSVSAFLKLSAASFEKENPEILVIHEMGGRGGGQ